MPTEQDLLPPNSTPLERALSLSVARLADIPLPMRSLWNPATCPADLLPWLAWALSIDRWRAEWSEEQKRIEVARAIELQRRKGTPASVEQVIASFDPLIRMLEWFEMEPPGIPHTFRVTIPIDGSPVPRSTAAFALEIVQDIYRVKPARSHFEMWLELATEASLFVSAGAQMMIYCRFELTANLESADDPLVTENGFGLLTEYETVIEVG